jgi:hypothetical protein
MLTFDDSSISALRCALQGAHRGVAWLHVREVCPTDSPVAI